jgi:hypothetical protein
MTDILAGRLSERLRERARIIGSTSEQKMPELEQMFEQVATLGRLLHAARQYLENQPEPEMKDLFPDKETIWLWERGLALPNEVTSGQLSAVVQCYVEHIQKQRKQDISSRLQNDIVSLYTALTGNTPSIDSLQGLT